MEPARRPKMSDELGADIVTTASKPCAEQCAALAVPELFSNVSVLHLSKRDREAFMAAIADPPEPTPALIRAVERYRRKVITDV